MCEHIETHPAGGSRGSGLGLRLDSKVGANHGVCLGRWSLLHQSDVKVPEHVNSVQFHFPLTFVYKIEVHSKQNHSEISVMRTLAKLLLVKIIT